MAIITLHSNTHMCGVSKFNRILATHLQASLISLDSEPPAIRGSVVVSLSFAELDQVFEERLEQVVEGRKFGLIVHGLSAGEFQEMLLRRAEWVLALNDEIYAILSSRNLKKLALGWCPPTISKPAAASREGTWSRQDPNQLFMFGMSKKFQDSTLDRLESVIGAESGRWKLVISAGLHENSSFDDAFFAKIDKLKARPFLQVFFAGFLSDEAVSDYLMSSRACVLAFQPAARANNSTLTSALDHGCQIITNIDQYTPKWMIESNRVIDIETLDSMPALPTRYEGLPDQYGWTSFVAKLTSLAGASISEV